MTDKNFVCIRFLKILERTEKAIHLELRSKDKIWIPLSLCKDLSEAVKCVHVAKWFYDKNISEFEEDYNDDDYNIRTTSSRRDINDFFGFEPGANVQGIDYDKNTYGLSPDELGEDYFRED